GVQGHTAFAIPFGTGNFDTVQTARAHDLDALGTQAHGVLHGAFHGAAELDAFFKLLSDGIGHQLSVGFGLADFFDVDVHRHAHQALQIGLQVLDVFAALADHDTRTSRVNRNTGILGRTLDDHATNGSAFQFLFQVFAYADIFSEHAAKGLVVRIPTRTPVTVNREAEPYRVYFLSHCDSLRADFDHNVASLLLDTVTAAFCTCGETLHRLALVHMDSGDFEFIDIGAVVVLGVGDR